MCNFLSEDRMLMMVGLSRRIRACLSKGKPALLAFILQGAVCTETKTTHTHTPRTRAKTKGPGSGYRHRWHRSGGRAGSLDRWSSVHLDRWQYTGFPAGWKQRQCVNTLWQLRQSGHDPHMPCATNLVSFKDQWVWQSFKAWETATVLPCSPRPSPKLLGCP